MTKDGSSDHDLVIKAHMEGMFPLQRNFINKERQLTREIWKEYPFLLEPKYIFQHFKQLMGFDPSRIGDNIRYKTPIILKFAKQLSGKSIKCLFTVLKSTSILKKSSII
jgi:hypothetical protein